MLRDAALVLGGVAAGVALALALRTTHALARLRAVEDRARQAEQRARSAAAKDAAIAITAAATAERLARRDELVLERLEMIRGEWGLAPKNASGRVDLDLFKEHMLATHADNLTEATTPSYDAFLDRCFEAGIGLMLAPGQPPKTDLGRHCFSYAMLLAGEWYFEAAAAAAGEACPCSTPVADQLALVTKPCGR